MLRFIFGVFMVLHGLVHLLYFGQSARYFALQPGLVWPDGSWALAKLLGDRATRTLASLSCVLAALGFVVGGIGMLVRLAWWRPVIIASAMFSAVLFLLCWDGKPQRMDDKGGIGILINLAILISLLVLQWPSL